MNDMDLTLLKQDIKAETGYDFSISFPKRSWFKQHRNGISGIVCLALAVLLPTLLVLQMKQIVLSPYNFGIITFTVVLAWYCLVRGIFTLLFQAKETEFGTSIHPTLFRLRENGLVVVSYSRPVGHPTFVPRIVRKHDILDHRFHHLSRRIGLVQPPTLAQNEATQRRNQSIKQITIKYLQL